VPGEIRSDISGGSGVEPNVIDWDLVGNGLPPHPVAANAARVRSKLGDAVRLLDAGEVAAARAALCAAMLALDCGKR
jgi:hypothetical protein